MGNTHDKLALVESFVRRFLLPFHPIRYFHTLLVRDIALSIGEFYPRTPRQSIYIATLCHDMAKYIPMDQAKTMALEYQEPFPSDLDSYPVCIHGFVAFMILKHQLGITDESILRAVRFHTTGISNWDHLGLILYVSDYLASNFASTSKEEFPDLYKEACSSITSASLMVYTRIMAYLEQSQKPIHPLSSEFHSWLQSPSSEVSVQ